MKLSKDEAKMLLVAMNCYVVSREKLFAGDMEEYKTWEKMGDDYFKELFGMSQNDMHSYAFNKKY